MDDSLEERIEDLEQLILRQNERIDMLEQRLEAVIRQSRGPVPLPRPSGSDEAA